MASQVSMEEGADPSSDTDQLGPGRDAFEGDALGDDRADAGGGSDADPDEDFAGEDDLEGATGIQDVAGFGRGASDGDDDE